MRDPKPAAIGPGTDRCAARNPPRSACAGTNPRIINVSSDAGSFAHSAAGCSYGYPASKAALNFMTRCLAADPKDAGVIVVSVHPGFVRTDMGGPGAHREPEETVPSLAGVIDRLTMTDSGGFFNWDAQTIAW